jgi:glyoxylase-like metal-dependent hydrolase (beta-lactamase superfamily II)
MIRVGQWEMESVECGRFRLDGGAMFGVVPKVIWARGANVDDQNRVLLANRALIATHGRSGRIVIVDTGTGSKWNAVDAERFAIQSTPEAIDDVLSARGASPDDVTDIVATHLHFDHCGGMTVWAGEPGGPTELRFPNARHWVHRRHWEHAHRPTLRDRASFLGD